MLIQSHTIAILQSLPRAEVLTVQKVQQHPLRLKKHEFFKLFDIHEDNIGSKRKILPKSETCNYHLSKPVPF